jgi:hypothetical protein
MRSNPGAKGEIYCVAPGSPQSLRSFAMTRVIILKLNPIFNIRFIKRNENNYLKYINNLASLRAHAKQSRGSKQELAFGPWIAAVASLLREDIL